jgi:AcrR family transcriptional regulator
LGVECLGWWLAAMTVHPHMKDNEMKKQALLVPESARQRIVAQARDRFFAFGFRAVTMDDLAWELGMSKRTLYAHFPSKVALVQAVLLDKSQDVEADLERITSEGSSDFAAKLHGLLACVQQHLGEIQPPFVRDIQREAPEIFKLVETRRRNHLHRYFGRFFDEGRTAGIFRKDIPPELITELLLAATQGIMNPEKMAELGLTPKSGFSAIITVILEGVLADTGRSGL